MQTIKASEYRLPKPLNLNQPAVVWHQQGKACDYSYAELLQTVKDRVYYFKDKLHISKGDVIAVLAPRGPEYLINLLAIWHLGAIYLPLSDMWNEKEALLSRVTDSKAQYLLTVSDSYKRYKSELKAWGLAKIIQLDKVTIPKQPENKALPTISLNKNDLAYIYSSSGTSGKPKLISLPHAGILDRIDDHISYMGIEQGEGILGFLDFGFDASLVEMLLALRSGNTLYVAPSSVRAQSLQALPHFIQSHQGKIQVAILIPSVLRGLKAKDCPGVTRVVTMGEACILNSLREQGWFQQARLFNGYGPTETTFGATLTELNEQDKLASIHRPMKGITIYLRESFSLRVGEMKHEEELERDCFYVKPKSGGWGYWLKDSLGKIYQGNLDKDLCKRCESLQSKEDKGAEAVLLTALIKQTIKQPRLIAQTENRELVPQGLWKKYFGQAINKLRTVRGEIVIGSNGVGTYLGLPKKVKEKYITEAKAKQLGYKKERLFISGDMGEYDGKQLEFKNRQDNQIKRYGMLVTLDEMEEGLNECDAIKACVVVYTLEGKLVAFMEAPESDYAKIMSSDEQRREASQQLWDFIYKEGKLDRKLRPNSYFWVKELPKQKQRDKVLRNLGTYQTLKPKPQRLLLVKSQQHTDKLLIGLSKIWQQVLEGKTDIIKGDTMVYDPNTTFAELGGDSLLTSVMIQQVWDYYRASEKHQSLKENSVVPNDFSRGVMYQLTLSGIKTFMACYDYQAVKQVHASEKGFAIFSFIKNLSPLNVGGSVYELSLPIGIKPQGLHDTTLKSLLIPLKRQCREVQDSGPYYIITDNTHKTIAEALAKEWEKLGEQVYLNVFEQQNAQVKPQSKKTQVNDIKVLQKRISKQLHEGLIKNVRKQLKEGAQKWLMQQEEVKTPWSETALGAQQRLGEYIQHTKINHSNMKTFWLLSGAGTGKSTLVKSVIKKQFMKQSGSDKSEELLILPLSVHGLHDKQLFSSALTKQFPRWKWDELKKLDIVFIVVGYDRHARQDCPNLWRQANDLGFKNVNWIITCRENYWRTFYPEFYRMEGEQNTAWQVCKFSQTVPQFAKISQQLSISNNPQSYKYYQVIESVTESFLTLTIAEQRYQWLEHWLTYEYRYQRTEIDTIPEQSFKKSVFDTLNILYKQGYIENNHRVWIGLQPSHWQLHEDLPSFQALPEFKTVLSLFELTQIKLNLIVKAPVLTDEYEKQLDEKLDINTLRLLREPSSASWSCQYINPLHPRIETKQLPARLSTALKKQIKILPFSYDGNAIMKLLEHWQPLQYLSIDKDFAREANSYSERYQKERGELANQGIETQEQKHLRQQLGQDFWMRFDSEQAHYHILPLAVVPESTPIFMFHPITGETPVHYRYFMEALGGKQTLYALQMSSKDWQRNIKDKVRLYEKYIKILQPQGPYMLIGWSFGAVVAYAVCHSLEKQKRKVDLLVNIDSPPPSHINKISEQERALDMIVVLMQQIFQVKVFQQNKFKALIQKNDNAENCFDKAITYLKNTAGGMNYPNAIKALHNAKINMMIYYDFAKWCQEESPKISAPYYVYEATEEKRRCLNEADYKLWKELVKNENSFTLSKIKGTHFTIFNGDLFQSLKPLLEVYQAEQNKSLVTRLGHYRQKRIEQLLKPIKKKQKDGIYIPATADEDQEGENAFDLMPYVEKFLYDKGDFKSQSFLLQGEPGSGKSHYSRQLEIKCWQGSYKFFPLWISLRPGSKELLRSKLLECGFTEQEYDRLLEALRDNKEDGNERNKLIHKIFGSTLLIIFDGYDEALTKENLYLKEELDLWNAKSFISCRSYAVNMFTVGNQFGDQQEKIQTLYLQPLNKEGIELYLKKHEHQTGKSLDRKILNQVETAQLLNNPLLLSIAVDFWNELPSIKNRAALYQKFFDAMFLHDVERICDTEGMRPSVSLIKAFSYYNQQLACQYWYYDSSKNSKALAIKEKVKLNYDTMQARQSMHLNVRKDGGLQHITFWEFQLAKAIIYAVARQDFTYVDAAFPSLLGEASITDNLSLLVMIREQAQNLPWHEFDRFRYHLLLTVYGSRYPSKETQQDKAKVQAASNAISILNVMKVPFSGLDMHGIRVPGAYLNEGIFHKTCLQKADLRHCKMHGVFMKYADLRYADLRGADFGMYMEFLAEFPVGSLAYHDKKNIFAVGSGKNIEIWGVSNLNNGQGMRLKVFRGHAKNILRLHFTNNNRLLSLSFDNTIKLWDIKSGSCLFTIRDGTTSQICAFTLSRDEKILITTNAQGPSKMAIWDMSSRYPVKLQSLSPSGHRHDIRAVVLNNQQTMLATASGARVILWRFESLTQITSFRGKFTEEVKFSPNGKLLAYSCNNNIELWDVDSLEKLATLSVYEIGIKLCFSHDSKLLAAVNGQGLLRLWDLRNGKLLVNIRASSARIYDLYFSKDNKILITASMSKQVLFWNVDKLINQNSYLDKRNSLERKIIYLHNNIAVLKNESNNIEILELTTLRTKAIYKSLEQSESYRHLIQNKQNIPEDKSSLGEAQSITPEIFDKSKFITISSNRFLGVLVYAQFVANLNLNNVALRNTKVSKESRFVFFQRDHNLIDSKYEFWCEQDKDLHKSEDRYNFPNAFLGLSKSHLKDIFYHKLMPHLNTGDVKVLALLNRSSNKYFSAVEELSNYIVNYTLPLLEKFKKIINFSYHNDIFHISFEDKTGKLHHKDIPSWYFKRVRTLTDTSQTLISTNIVAPETMSAPKAKNASFLLTSNSTRELVYFISSTYLLSHAIGVVTDKEFFGIVGEDKIPLGFVYDYLSKYDSKKILRLLDFLSKNGILLLDNKRKTVSMAPKFSKPMRALRKLKHKEIEKLVKECQISYKKNSMVFSGSPLSVITTLYYMKQFCRYLHWFTRWQLFDVISKGTNTLKKIASYCKMTYYIYELFRPDDKNNMAEIRSFFYKERDIQNVSDSDYLLDQVIADAIFYLEKFHFLRIDSNTNQYRLTALSEYLLSNKVDSLQSTLSIIDYDWWDIFAESHPPRLDHMLGNNRPYPFDRYFSYINDNPEMRKKYISGMVGYLKKIYHALLKYLKNNIHYSLENYNAIVILSMQVVEVAEIIYNFYLKKPTLFLHTLAISVYYADNINAKGCLIKNDVLKPNPDNKIPENKHLYLIDSLGYFNNEKSLKILKNIRENMFEKSKLYVIDRILPYANGPHINHYSNIMMWILFDGKVRYKDDWLRLFLLSGLFWENFDSPIEVIDHSVMICRPYTPEIPKGLSFFDNNNKASLVEKKKLMMMLQQEQSYLFDQKIKHKLDIKAIDNSLQSTTQDYFPDYFYLCQHAISPDEDSFRLLYPVNYTELSKVRLKLNDVDENFVVLPIYIKADESKKVSEHWVALLIDKFDERVFYIDPLKKSIPDSVMSLLLKQSDIKFSKASIYGLSNNKEMSSHKGSSIILISLLSVALQKTKALELPKHGDKNSNLWLQFLHKMIMPLNNNSIETLREQHLRWVSAYITEIHNSDVRVYSNPVTKL